MTDPYEDGGFRFSYYRVCSWLLKGKPLFGKHQAFQYTIAGVVTTARRVLTFCACAIAFYWTVIAQGTFFIMFVQFFSVKLTGRGRKMPCAIVHGDFLGEVLDMSRGLLRQCGGFAAWLFGLLIPNHKLFVSLHSSQVLYNLVCRAWSSI